MLIQGSKMGSPQYIPNYDIAKNTTFLCGSFNPIHSGHIELLESGMKLFASQTGYFELAVTNCDKGTIPVQSLKNRIKQFVVNKLDLIITHEPLFVGKSRLFKECNYVMGFDTFERIINAKYYGEG